MTPAISEDRMKRTLAILREHADRLPDGFYTGVYRGVPVESFAREDVLRFVTVVMVEVKNLRERVRQLEKGT